MREERGMVCMVCGQEELVEVGEQALPWPTLPHVIVEGVKVHRCEACGELEYGYERVEELRQVLKQALLQKPGRLEGNEIRYLRKAMGWSGRDLAARMSVSAEQVSRWENGHDEIGAGSNLLLRALIALDERLEDYSSKKLSEMVGRQLAGGGVSASAIRRDPATQHWLIPHWEEAGAAL